MMKRILYDFCNSLDVFYYLYKLNQYRKSLFLNEDDLKKLQLKKLKILIRYAYQKVYYYRKLLDAAGIKPEDINSLEDLYKIPITTKETIQSLSKNQIISNESRIAHCTNLRTSGSTGEPLDIFIDKKDELIRRISLMRIYLENGRTIKDKVLIIVTPKNFLRKRWFHPILYHLNFFQEKYISIHEDKNSILKVINDYQPNIILTYTSIIKELAWELEKRNIAVTSVRMVFLTGELLSDEDKLFIKSIFNTEVFDYYACNECDIIAWECKQHKGYHINADNVILEFLKKDGVRSRAEEEGEIVITNLNSFTMPFIRYRLGDIGVPSDEKCPCGRTSPLMKGIIGRCDDYFILPSGKKVYPFFLRQVLRYVPGINQYQMIQEKKDRVRIKIVKNGKFSSKAVFEIKENCESILGSDVGIEIEFPEGIPRSKTGKFQAIKSELSQSA